jgi:Fe-S-cluster containining protein
VSAIDQLCPACGLCCNGVLFGDVELQRGDDAKKLASLGVELFTKGRKKVFNQPCACLVGGLCKIYQDRPARCRAFDCRALQRVQQGKLTVAAAHKAIAEAKRCSEEVLRLVRALGDASETRPLNRRYAAIMAQPMDLAGDEAQLELRGELMMAVGRLVEVLERDFLV